MIYFVKSDSKLSYDEGGGLEALHFLQQVHGGALVRVGLKLASSLFTPGG